MINYNGDCKEIAELLERYNGYPVSPDIGYPTPGSLGDYGPEVYKAPVITFECPLLSEGHTLKGIWEENQEGLKLLMHSDLIRKGHKK
jgi:protein MpaA